VLGELANKPRQPQNNRDAYPFHLVFECRIQSVNTAPRRTTRFGSRRRTNYRITLVKSADDSPAA
jgi:hypothetical protein